MNWLITGGCGFIGSNLCAQLMDNTNDRIRIIDNLKYGVSALLKDTPVIDPESVKSLDWEDRIIIYKGDVRDSELAIKLCKGADVVIHLAANTGVGPSIDDPMLDLDVNVLGTVNYLMAAKEQHVKRFIFASSGAPAGNVNPPIHENIVPRPVSPYGASKLAGEAYCSAFYNSFNVETVALRFSNVYGPYSATKASVVAKMFRYLLAGEKIQIYGDGNQTRDFIFISDLVEAIIAAVRVEGIGGHTFQIATGVETTINELVTLMRSIFERKHLPWPGEKMYPVPVGDVRRNYASPKKAERYLNWSATKELEEGLAETLDYFNSQKLS